MKEALPNAVSIEKCLKRTGQQFSLRGIEVVVDGIITRSDEQWQLLVPGEKPLKLKPLTEKVQWDAKNKQRATLSESEAAALARLSEEAASRRERLRVIGPLRRDDKGELTLEVRDFSWMKPQKAQKSKPPLRVAKTRK